MSPLIIKWYVFIVGLCVGSFLNVCIHRVPEGRSIVSPPSACPKCSRPIRWYENIPILSYILLRGRCRGCQTFISLRYPLVELLVGVLAMATWSQFGTGWPTLIYFGFLAALVVITFIDLDHRIIPDIISLPGIPIGFAASFALPAVTWVESLMGIAIGGGILLTIAVGYQFLTGKDGMGGGDIKLLAMIGAFIGWKGVIFTIMTSSLIGTVVGLFMMLRAGKGMRMAVPFGPFLSMGAVLYLFFGPRIVQWYLNLI